MEPFTCPFCDHTPEMPKGLPTFEDMLEYVLNAAGDLMKECILNGGILQSDGECGLYSAYKVMQAYFKPFEEARERVNELTLEE